MATNSDCVIISVESRKGGVGKTTAALNLARILLEQRKRAVLFLDVDITGTNVMDCLDAPFWKDICHAVADCTKKKPDPANLLALFERQFMPGLGIPGFMKKGARKSRSGNGCLGVAPDKINVIGSQVYDLTGSRKEENGDTCICKPSILFDELHAFWFVEFLQKICDAFLEVIRKDEPDRAAAVIVDNSPGYVGIAPAVQEWLTDLGPEKGKFLTVSSLDTQDLRSCGHAIHNLHRLYSRKWQTSRKFASAPNHKTELGKELALAPEEEGFFLRLVEAQPLRSVASETSRCTSGVSGDDLAFYRKDDNAQGGGLYLDHPEGYQGLVINRVPLQVKRGVYTYDAEQMYSLMRRRGSELLDHLLGDDRSSYTEWMVSYDESIEYQFLQPMISRRFGRTSRRKGRFETFMHLIEERHAIPPDGLLQEMLHSGRHFDPRMLSEARMYLRNVDDSVRAVIRLVEQAGFAHLTHLVQEEWLPGNILRDVRIEVQEVLLESGIPFGEFAPWEPGEERFDEAAWMFIKDFRHLVRRHVEEGHMHAPIEAAEQFIQSLTVVLALSMDFRWWDPQLGPELPKLFADIAAMEALHWVRSRKRSKRSMSIQRFLAAEKVTEKEWGEWRHHLRIHSRLFERAGLSRLYRACASAQARLIDVRRDAEFLIALIQRLVVEDIREAPVLPYIRGVAEKVIVKKTVSHESGRKTIAKGFSSAQYMEEFSEVLEKILARWEARQWTSA